jgi:PAS domain S-box-containing protein
MTDKETDLNNLIKGAAASFPEDIDQLSPQQIRQMLHDLHMHQIELEMQSDELRTTQLELEAARARYFDLYDLAPVGYCTISDKGIILEANLTITTLLGVTRSALVMQPASHYILPADQDKYYLYLKKIFKTDNPQICELRMVRVDESSFWAQLKSTIAQNVTGEVISRTVINDITEQKATQKALQISEQCFREMFQGHKAVMLLVEPDTGIILDANHAAAQFYGYPHDTLCRMRITDINQLAPEQVFAEIRNADAEGRSYLIHPHRLANNETRIVELHSSPISVNEHRVLFSIVHDITERKAAEDRIRLYLDIVEVIIVALDRTGAITLINRKGCELLGYENKALLNRNWFEIAIPGPQRAAASELFQATMNRSIEPPEYFENIILTENGRERTIAWHASLLHDPNGAITGMLSSGEDITERVTAKTELKLLNEELEQKITVRTEELDRFFTVALDLLCIADTSGNFRRVNIAWQNVLGYSIKDLEGRKFLDFIHPDDMPATLEAIGTLSTQKEVWNFVNRYRCRDGSYRWIEWRATPVKERIYAAARDITERRAFERELEDITERFTIATTSAEVGIWDWDIRSDKLIWTDQMFLLYGIERETFGGTCEAWMSGIHPDDRAIARGEIDAALHGLSEFKTEFRVVWPNGTIRFLKAFAKVHRDTNDRAIRMVGTNWDITQEREIQQKLVHALNEADKANLAKSEFLANMSHEIRTPLNAVIGFSELLADNSSNDIQKKHIASIKTAGKSLLRMVNDILDLSKIEAGMLKIQPAPLELSVIFSEIELVFAARIAEKGLQFNTDISPALPLFFDLDEHRLRQVLLNIVGNAVKFTENGMVNLSAASVPCAGAPDTIILVIAVEDSGIGIPFAEQEMIFEKFHQQSGQSSAKYGGTGLGLTISRRLVEMMGGRISLVSEPGRGSIFTIQLDNVKTITAISSISQNPGSNRKPAPAMYSTDSTPAIGLPIPKVHSPAVRQLFTEKIIPLVNASEGVFKMDDIRTLARQLLDIGSSIPDNEITRWGTSLVEATDAFDIPCIRKILATLRTAVLDPLPEGEKDEGNR